MTIEDGGCNPEINSDLTFVDNQLHVVYGTCGPDCCGKADVEYNYRPAADGDIEITRYAALVRLDPTCFQSSTDDDPKQYMYLICHELGHALGLGHNTGAKSCLGIYDGSTNYLPGQDDLDLLNTELFPKGETSAEGVEESGIAPLSAATPAESPTSSPTAIPISSDDDNPGILTIIATKDCTQNECQLCQGDCDADSDCIDELKCFFRSDYEPIPGCKGEGIVHKDYCYDPATIKPVDDGMPVDYALLTIDEGNIGRIKNTKSPTAIAFISLAAILISTIVLVVFIFTMRRRRAKQFLSDSKHPIQSNTTADDDGDVDDCDEHNIMEGGGWI
mmetsp:Transcript_618/g.1297  ORF Transcript_618/g.1297 Transcript_618/m.1297 type:complete len:333 (+) Transcript_618:94-1092(+)